MSGFTPVLKIVRLPDGRWAIENGEGVDQITREDVQQIHDAWMIWADIRWRVLAQRDGA